jgi:hypothetical protein
MAQAALQNCESAARRIWRLSPWTFCLLSPFLLLPAGCAPDDFGPNDPFYGVGPAAPPPPGSPRPPVAGALPPPPPPPTSGMPAALASNVRPTLDPATPPLRIGAAGESTAPSWQGPGGSAGAVLQPPQPSSSGSVPLQPKPDVQLTSNTTTPTYDQLVAQLKARGVSDLSIRKNFATGETTLICWVPQKDNPSQQQKYEATKARDEVSAMQAVIEQIDGKR